MGVKISDLPKLTKLSDSAVIIGEESSGTSAITLANLKTQLLAEILPKTAAAHNSIYRGKDLTSYFNNGGMSTAIAAGTFDDIFPGDYITKSVTIDGTTYSNVKWLVADLDYNYNRGSTNKTTHHVVMIPASSIGRAAMNSTNITTGGYLGSEMYTTTIPKYVTGIVAAFGSSHVMGHQELLTNAVDDNATSPAGNGWTGVEYFDWSGSPYVIMKVNIPNQIMIYGSAPYGSAPGNEAGVCPKQLAIFRFSQEFILNEWCWTRDICKTGSFAGVGSNGRAAYDTASTEHYVRPYFMLY